MSLLSRGSYLWYQAVGRTGTLDVARPLLATGSSNVYCFLWSGSVQKPTGPAKRFFACQASVRTRLTATYQCSHVRFIPLFGL
jgi:hypothetical protein